MITAEVVSADYFDELGNKFVKFFVVYSRNDKFLVYKEHNINISLLPKEQSIEDKLATVINYEKKALAPLLNRGEEIQGLMGKVF